MNTPLQVVQNGEERFRVMMSPQEYKRVSALRADELESYLQGLGLHGYAGDRKSYRARLSRIRVLQREGKGPGAWFERFIHECRKARR